MVPKIKINDCEGVNETAKWICTLLILFSHVTSKELVMKRTRGSRV